MSRQLKDCLQILLLILSEFKRINELLFLLKSSENHKFYDDFTGKRSWLICHILINSPLICLILEVKFGDHP